MTSLARNAAYFGLAAAVTVMTLGTAQAGCGGDDAVVTPEDASPDGVVSDDASSDVFSQDSTTQQDGGTDSALTDSPNDTTGDAGDATDAPTDGPQTLDGALCDGGSLTVASVTPLFGWTGGKTPITITGSGFVATPKVFLRNTSTSTLYPIAHAAFVSATSMSAEVPAGMPVATYDVGVQNPDSCAAYLTGQFKVVANPTPSVVSVAPGAGTTQVNTNVTVTGCHFSTIASGVGLATVDSALASVPQGMGTATCGGVTTVCADGSPLCTFTGTIASTALTPGAYLVRVTNLGDQTYDDYSTFVVTNPAVKLGAYTTNPGSSLTVGRRALGLVSGRINDANRFLYAVGGEDAAGVALTSVEVVALDKFGHLGVAPNGWFVQKAKLNQARSGLAVVRQGKYIYALGGTSSALDGTKGVAPSGTPLATIERARILDISQAPVVTDPPTTSGASGSLAAGTWYYKVSAVMVPGDPDNGSGESLASDEVVATLTAAGSVTLNWSAVPNAAYYRAYRSAGPNGTSQSEVLIADNLAALTYTDTGATALSEVPVANGSTGNWVTQTATTLLHARLNTAAAVGPDGAGGLRVYVIGGWGSCTGGANTIMGCAESASFSATGDALGAFTAAASPLVEGRMRHGISVLTSANAPQDAGASPNFVVIAGGYGGGGGSDAGTLSAVEYAPITSAAGGLGAWVAANNSFPQRRDGTQIAIVNGEAYDFMGGIAPNQYAGTGFLTALNGVSSTSITFGNWSSNATALPSSAVLGRFGLTLESAYFYVAAGTSNDTDALKTVYQILY